MCRLVAAWIALLVGTPAGALASSSPISPEDSSSIAAPDSAWTRTEEIPDTTGTGTAEEIRESIDEGKWEQALQQARSAGVAALEESDAARYRLLEARILERMGDLGTAVRTYRRLLDREDVGEEARSELHDLYVRRGMFEAADHLTEAAEEPGGGSDRVLAALRAYSFSTQGRYREAARLTVEGAVAGDDRSRVLRANALMVLGDRDEARDLYLEVLRESKDRKIRQIAHFGLGQVARLEGGRAVRAIQDERAVRLGPAPWAELDWGLALRALGRRDEARERLGKVVHAYPELAPTARLALARLDEEEGKVDDAFEDLAASLTGSTTDFLGLVRLGALLLQEGDEDEAIDSYRAALELFPDFPPAREKLTRALTSLGRWEEAGAATPPTEVWTMPGWTWDRMMDGDLPYYTVVADRDSIPPDDPRRFVLAVVHLRAGNAGAVLGWTEGAGPKQGLLASVRAEALERVGRTEDAIELWESLLDAGEGGPVARERLAGLLFDTEPARAEKLWREVFVRYPHFPRARIRMAERLERADRLLEALDAYREAEGTGWLSRGERKRIRLAIEDLEDALEDQQEEEDAESLQ